MKTQCPRCLREMDRYEMIHMPLLGTVCARCVEEAREKAKAL